MSQRCQCPLLGGSGSAAAAAITTTTTQPTVCQSVCCTAGNGRRRRRWCLSHSRTDDITLHINQSRRQRFPFIAEWSCHVQHHQSTGGGITRHPTPRAGAAHTVRWHSHPSRRSQGNTSTCNTGVRRCLKN